MAEKELHYLLVMIFANKAILLQFYGIWVGLFGKINWYPYHAAFKLGAIFTFH